MKSLFLTASGESHETWVDANGHVNIAEYTKVIDTALSNFISLPGSLSVFLGSDISCVVRKYFVHHISELVHPVIWSVETGLVSLSSHGFVTIHLISSSKKKSAKFFVQSTFFDLKTRKSKFLSKEEMGKFSFPFVEGIESPFGEFDDSS